MDKKVGHVIFKTFIFIISLSLGWYLVKSGILNIWVETVLSQKLIANFISGAFYSSFFTSPLSVAMLLVLAKDQNPIILASMAGLGAALADFLIVRLFRDNIEKDFSFLIKKFKLDLIKKLLKLFKLDFIIPLFGAIIIASPFPDEVGLFLLGASNLKYYQIIFLTFTLNTAGILLIVTPINLLK